MSGLKVGVALSQVHLLNTIARPYGVLGTISSREQINRNVQAGSQ